MPTYNYGPCTNEECEGFEQTYQHNKKMAEYKDPQPCPFCGEMHERAVGDYSRAVAFKGPGWFNTGGYGAGYKPVGDLMRRSDSKK